MPSQTWSPIGLDIGGRYVKAAQLSRSPDGWRIEATACFPRVTSEAELDRRQVQQIHDVLSRQGFRGRSVVLAVPAGTLLTAILELPPRSSGAPLEQIARAELARMYKCDAQSIEISCWDLPVPSSADGSTAVMATSCRHADARELLKAFEDTGLGVKALDVHTCALARACEPALARQEAFTALLDIGWSSTQLVILHQGVIIYEEALAAAGMKTLSLTLARRLKLKADTVDCLLAEIGLDPDAAGAASRMPFEAVRGAIAAHCREMAKDTQTTFTNAAHQYPGVSIGLVLLVGGGAAIPGLAGQLAAELGVEVRAVAAADLVDCSPSLREQSERTELAMAIGLAQFSES